MDAELQQIMEKAREISLAYGIRNLSMDELCKKLSISKKTLHTHVKNKSDFIKKMLEFERERFKSIFDEYNFEGVNAIDILLTVSKELALRFKDINPALSFELKKYYPKLYQAHFEDRQAFIFEKSKINITKGINQGMYREDLSIELVARSYLCKLIDIHNPELFPPEKFSFQTLFNFMIDNLIRSIATKKGLEYYEQQVQAYKKTINA